ncbi:MAG: sulfatase-like hydrolase/transferase [Ornithinimicrobium sp.]
MSAGDRPDVLILHTDQWRWDALGCLGSQVRTPVVDQLAAAGLHFDHAVVQSPVSMPSRVSILTGRYPSSLGITSMGVPVPVDVETLARIVGRRGWRTANHGKLHFQPHANRDHTLPHPSYGFDVLRLCDEPGVYEDDYRAWVRSVDPSAVDSISIGLPPAAAQWQSMMGLDPRVMHPDDGPREDFDGPHPFGADASLTHTAWVATSVMDHLAALPQDQPSMCIANFFAPHPPFYVPRRFLDLYHRDDLTLPVLDAHERDRQGSTSLPDERLRAIKHGYFAAISEVDHHIGRILERLEQLGRAERTIVILLSDHGEWLGDHLRLAKGYPADDPVARVPLIIRWPEGIARPGRRVSDVVELLDVMPTVLDAAGLPIPTDVQGQSLLPALRGEPLRRLDLGITEHERWTSVRSSTHHYLVHEDGTERLWDIGADPTEHHELVGGGGQQAEATVQSALARHRHLLLQRQLQARRELPRTFPY